MTNTRSLAIFILANVCLFVMISTSIAQFIIDTNGESVEEGDEYFIRPAITGNGGSFSLVLNNGSCPWNVGLDNPDLPHGLTVVFIPFVSHHDEDDVRHNRDLRIQFIASTTCGQSTDWRL
ncbi:kunitz type trypsin inhibitor, partial [Trifolium pratense]